MSFFFSFFSSLQLYVPPVVGSTVEANAVSVRLEEALKALIAQHRVVSH